MEWQVHRPYPLPAGPTAVLVVSPDRDDHAVLRGILTHAMWVWQGTESCRRAVEILSGTPPAILICESRQRDGYWQDLLAAGSKLVVPPNLIVCSRQADERLWAEVLNLGGYDVLAKPFVAEEVLRAVALAGHSWKCRSSLVAASTPVEKAIKPLAAVVQAA